MSHITFMYVWGFCNAWTLSSSLDFTSFLDYAFKALYVIFFKDPVINCLPYKWYQVQFQITFKKPVAQVLLQVAHKIYISGPFYEQANLPQNLHYFWYTYAIIREYLLFFHFFKILWREVF